MKLAITKTNVDRVICGKLDVFIWDTALKGFGVKITSQDRRVFIFQYRDHRRKTKRKTIGKMGDLTVLQARREAERLRGRVLEQNGNLEGTSAQPESILTVAELSKRFLENYVCDLKPRTQVEYKRVFSTYLPQNILRLVPQDVTRSMTSELRTEMRENPHGFNRTVKVMSKFYNWLYDAGVIHSPTNPFQRVRQYKEKSSERYLSKLEIDKILNEIGRRKASSNSSQFALAAIELLICTGARKSEILTLRWSEVCLDTGVLNLEDSKTGKKTIYLNQFARRVLTSLPTISGNPFVIVGRKEKSHLSDVRKTWQSVCQRAGISHTRVHDLRHTFASIALKNGVKLETIGALLGHSDPRTTSRYVHFDNEFVKDENEKTGNALRDEFQL